MLLYVILREAIVRLVLAYPLYLIVAALSDSVTWWPNTVGELLWLGFFLVLATVLELSGRRREARRA